LKSVWYSSAVSSVKPELSSVYIHNEDGMIVFAATDSFRLAEKKIKLKDVGNFNNILIPFKNIGEIIRVLDDFNEDVNEMIKEFPINTLADVTNLDPEVWEDESFEIVSSFIYKNIQKDEKLPEEYIVKGQRLAKKQLVTAGYRLAKVLKKLRIQVPSKIQSDFVQN